MEYDNTNSGAAFLKDNANPKAPKWAGPVNIDGQDKEVSIWERTSKAGKTFLSLKFGPPREKKAFTPHDKAKSNGYQPQREDDIPF